MIGDRTRFRSMKLSESRSKKTPVTYYSTIIITNGSQARVHEIAFLLRFRVDGRTRRIPQIALNAQKIRVFRIAGASKDCRSGSPRTTKLSDRTDNQLTLDEMEKISV